MKEKLLEAISNIPGAEVVETSEFRDQLSITVNPEKIIDVARELHDNEELSFEMCVDVTAIDWAKRTDRFTVVYHIYSLKNNFRLRLKANISDSKNPEIESVTPVWKSANWYERETWDMYGIVFKNHPDHRRMYLPEDFEYHPLRKEFPVLGIPGSIPLPNPEE